MKFRLEPPIELPIPFLSFHEFSGSNSRQEPAAALTVYISSNSPRVCSSRTASTHPLPFVPFHPFVLKVSSQVFVSSGGWSEKESERKRRDDWIEEAWREWDRARCDFTPGASEPTHTWRSGAALVPGPNPGRLVISSIWRAYYRKRRSEVRHPGSSSAAATSLQQPNTWHTYCLPFRVSSQKHQLPSPLSRSLWTEQVRRNLALISSLHVSV